MKSFLFGFAIVSLVFLPSGAKGQGNICSQGILIRSGGAVIIDSWKSYDIASGQPQPGSTPIIHDFPTNITLGKTLPGKLLIGIESDEGIRYVSLDAIRKVK